jgi:hypothetical protein
MLETGTFRAAPTGGDDGAVGSDALPPIETGTLPDVVVTNCSSPSVQYIYLVTYENHLWSYYPPSGRYSELGTLDCPTTSTPFSMAVDRQGVAYVLYSSGEIFRVSTRTVACTPTAFTPPDPSYGTFGMAFVGDPNGATDTLYIATPTLLATVDLTTLQPTAVGPMTLLFAELTGTTDGRLFSFYSTDTTGDGTAIAELDPSTAAVVANTNLVNLPRGNGWAFGLWGGDFYLFTAPGGFDGTSTVTRFRPSDGTQTTLPSLPEVVVGAGVSTCAAQM